MEEKDEPQFMVIDETSQEFQETIIKAKNTLGYFKQKLLKIGEEWTSAVNIFIPEAPDSEEGLYIWLANPIFEGDSCTALIFELPKEVEYLSEDQWIKFPIEDIVDWYLLSDSGELEGGFSLRYQRELLSPDKRSDFDELIGVKRFLDIELKNDF
ncbi:MAG: DUF2314 domain-containing protein [Candidatus Lokiarchaeota archaeon]|nr:DUF2314 domain-containing protein [Candidatus Lokiarchaeota archaeon]